MFREITDINNLKELGSQLDTRPYKKAAEKLTKDPIESAKMLAQQAIMKFNTFNPHGYTIDALHGEFYQEQVKSRTAYDSAFGHLWKAFNLYQEALKLYEHKDDDKSKSHATEMITGINHVGKLFLENNNTYGAFQAYRRSKNDTGLLEVAHKALEPVDISKKALHDAKNAYLEVVKLRQPDSEIIREMNDLAGLYITLYKHERKMHRQEHEMEYRKGMLMDALELYEYTHSATGIARVAGMLAWDHSISAGAQAYALAARNVFQKSPGALEKKLHAPLRGSLDNIIGNGTYKQGLLNPESYL